MYVPGLSQWPHHGHIIVIKNNGILLCFALDQTSVTLTPFYGGNNLAADICVHEHCNEHTVPSTRQRDHSTNKKRLSLELLHNRLGHRKCCTLLTASEHNLREDVTVCMSPEAGCLSCGIAIIRSTAHNKEHHTGASTPGEYIFMDIIHPATATGLTPSTSYAFYLILVDAFSRYTCLYGMPDKTTDAVVTAIKQHTADIRWEFTYGYVDIARNRADTGT